MENKITEQINDRKDINAGLTGDSLSLRDLKTYLGMKFRGNEEAARKVNITSSRVRQILIGYNLPKSARIIWRLAEGWNIDPVKLALLFERTPNFVTADKYIGGGLENDNN